MKRPIMSWAGIDEFFTVAQTRSFTQAGKRLGTSTSHISREVARLEDRMGQRLLHRSTRHVTLTDAGVRFVERCGRLIEDRDEAVASLQDEPSHLAGLLRMTCGERFIVPMINRFMLRQPQLRVEFVLWNNDSLDLIDQGLDLAVRFGAMTDSRLVAVRIGARKHYLCAAPSYLESKGIPAALEALADHDCVCRPESVWPFLRNGRIYEHAPSGRFQCNSGFAVVDAALSGLGLCQLPDFYVEEHLHEGSLVEVLAEHRPKDQDVWAVYAHRRHVPLKVKLAIEHLQAEFRHRETRPEPLSTILHRRVAIP